MVVGNITITILFLVNYDSGIKVTQFDSAHTFFETYIHSHRSARIALVLEYLALQL